MQHGETLSLLAHVVKSNSSDCDFLDARGKTRISVSDYISVRVLMDYATVW